MINNKKKNMKDLIKTIIKEETDQIEDKKSNLKNKLKNIVDEFGIDQAIKIVGGIENYIKIVYDGDLKNFFKESGINPYYMSSEPNLYLDDMLVQLMELPEKGFSKKEKSLGDFRWTSNGTNYRFTASLYPITYSDGRKMWRVIGHSGDSGFGYSFITKRNTLGKRARLQIFQQIIDKYDLNKYK
jgi:hypothetical protein